MWAQIYLSPYKKALANEGMRHCEQPLGRILTAQKHHLGQSIGYILGHFWAIIGENFDCTETSFGAINRSYIGTFLGNHFGGILT
jgi:hypothetical protein